MQRRTFLQSALTAPLIAAPRRPPNFLFLIADDLTFRAIGGLNNPEVRTPNLDGLVRRGCTFTHCFHQGSWTGAVCVPSRTMLNSGLSTFRAQKPGINGVPLWGETLGQAGYETHMVGKWHLSEPNLKRSFQATGPVSGGMFESGPEQYNRPAPGNTWTPWDTSLKGQWLPTEKWEPAAREPIRHSAAVWADYAAEYLRGRQGRPDPFFLYVGFNSPHDPRQAPREFVDLYPRDRIQIPPNYLPEHPFDQGDARVRDENYAHISYLDAQVGRILDALDASGQRAHTYLIFTADHGLAVGQHGLMGKQNLYDHSIRMPLLISGPGIKAGRRVDHMVYQHSTFATTCELAGVPIPGHVEFPSLVPHLRGRAAAPHDAMFCRYIDYQRAVRTRTHKLILYPKAGVTQLFDIDRDPWEVTNLAGRAETAGVERQLRDRLGRFQKDLGDDLA
jgi:choline-sulfatase